MRGVPADRATVAEDGVLSAGPCGVDRRHLAGSLAVPGAVEIQNLVGERRLGDVVGGEDDGRAALDALSERKAVTLPNGCRPRPRLSSSADSAVSVTRRTAPDLQGRRESLTLRQQLVACSGSRCPRHGR